MKRYHYKLPQKCVDCSKAAECDFVKHFNDKPYDISGVILGCNAFFSVFTELEARHRSSIEDLGIENDEENTPFLVPAMITNGALAAELALKALILRENGFYDCVHRLDDLYNTLPDTDKERLSMLLKERLCQDDTTLMINLERIGNCFEQWWYFHEYDNMGYSNSLTGFIHIV